MRRSLMSFWFFWNRLRNQLWRGRTQAIRAGRCDDFSSPGSSYREIGSCFLSRAQDFLRNHTATRKGYIMRVPLLDLSVQNEYLNKELMEAIKKAISHHQFINGPEVPFWKRRWRAIATHDTRSAYPLVPTHCFLLSWRRESRRVTRWSQLLLRFSQLQALSRVSAQNRYLWISNPRHLKYRSRKSGCGPHPEDKSRTAGAPFWPMCRDRTIGGNRESE